MKKSFSLGLLGRACLMGALLMSYTHGSVPVVEAAAPVLTSSMQTALKKAIQQKALAIQAVPHGASIPSPAQSLTGQVDTTGMTIVSHPKNTQTSTFSIKSSTMIRGETKRISIARKGVLAISDRQVTINKGILSEILTTSSEGLRQDFVIPKRPAGTGALTLEATVSGATVHTEANQIRLTLDHSKRAMLYRKLLATDAAGKTVPAHFVAAGVHHIDIALDDARAVYPIKIDPTISNADWSAMGSGADGIVYTLAIDSHENIYAGGAFSWMDGMSTPYVAKWNGNTWSAMNLGFNGVVNGLAVDSHDVVYAVGAFGASGGTTINHVAYWNGTAWSPVGTGVDGTVSAITIDSFGKIIIGGSFATTGEGDTVNNIAIWDGVSWSALGSGVDGTVYALTTDAYGKLYAGGAFTSASGTPAAHIASWDGSSWSALGDGVDGIVLTLISDASSHLYVGGAFVNAGGSSVNDIAMWDGAAWNALSTGMSPASQVEALAIDSFGNLIAGGQFNQASGVDVYNMAQWDGAAWTALGHGTSDETSALISDTVAGNNDVIVGGNFYYAGALVSPYIAKLHMPRKLIYIPGAHGSLTGSLIQGVNYGGAGTAVTAVPDSGYAFLSWSDASTTNPRTDANVTSSKTLTVSFVALGGNQAPNTPASLGQSDLIDGSTTSTGTPSFSFTISDPDVGDLLKYQIQVCVSSTYDLPLIDYTSDGVVGDGVRTFTVGQALNSGSYARGSVGQVLASGNYYWRVRAIDGSAALSSYADARGGGLSAFTVSALHSVQFQTNGGSGFESVTSTSIKIVLDTPSAGPVTTTYAVTGGTAVGGGVDYTLASGEAVIAPGDTSTTIPFTVVNNALADADRTIEVTLSSPVGADLGSNTVYTYTIMNDDVDGVIITQDGPFDVTEGGAVHDFNAVLTAQPASDVQIAFTTSTNGLTFSTSTLTFNSVNWNVPQIVHAFATDDHVFEGTMVTSVQPLILTSDLGYSSVILFSFGATIHDNDAAGVTLSKNTAAVTEGGAIDTYTVVLQSEPTSTVQVLLHASNGDTLLSTSTLEFTNLDWNTPKIVTTTALDDAIAQGTHTTDITHTASSTVLGYNSGLSIGSVLVTITDNDVAPPAGGGGGSSPGFTVLAPTLVPTSVTTTPIEVTFLDLTPTTTVSLPTLIVPIATPVPEAPSVVVSASDEPPAQLVNARAVWPIEDGDVLTNGLRVPRDFVTEARTTRHVKEDLIDLKMKATTAQIDRLQHFMAYGDSWATMRLGEGERRAVIRDVLQTLQIPNPSAEDLDAVSRGIRPRYRNILAEQAQLSSVRRAFKALYVHEPNFADRNENKAWNVLMYRIRFIRDLKKEEKGYQSFIKLLDRTPKSPLDWSMVRVLGYVT